MKKWLLMLLMLWLPLAALAETDGYAVNNPHSTWVHLRAQPTTQSESLGRYDNGTDVTVLDQTGNGWYHVRVQDKTGYMLTGMVTRVNSLSDETRIVGYTGDGDYIIACTAPNGQTICFTSIEEKPMIKMEDVNFDGMSDIVVFTARGASNFFCEFFVFDGLQYVQARHPALSGGLCNYQLYPEEKIVHSGANNGYAGALHEDCLFRWDGTVLVLLRRAVSDHRTEMEDFEDGYALKTYLDQLHVTVRDYTANVPEGELIWERIVETDQMDADFFREENDALWQGLR